MQANRYLIIILLILVCTSCIEPFSPVIEDSQEVLVINGMITDKQGMHYVDISRSTPYDDPSPKPVGECIVIVTDDNGEMIQFLEEEPGKYSADIPSSFLVVGKAYSLQVITPENEEYHSEYDTILPCPPIDSVYYEIQYLETADPEVFTKGIQFYMDMEGSDIESRNFKWQLEETWEEWASLFSQYIWWGGEVIKYRSNDIFKCWQTLPIRELYTASTRNLSVNALKRNKLNYVSNKTDRLRIIYSLLVQQQSLTWDSYLYWKKIRTQATESGGLYETQPSSAIGNLYNVNDPDEIVLGIFYASQVQTKRVMLNNVDSETQLYDFEIPYLSCEWGWFIPSNDFPYYMKSDHPSGYGPPYLSADRICFDCRIQGGTNIKPDFWEP